MDGQQDKLTELTSGVFDCKQGRHLVGETKGRREATVMVGALCCGGSALFRTEGVVGSCLGLLTKTAKSGGYWFQH